MIFNQAFIIMNNINNQYHFMKYLRNKIRINDVEWFINNVEKTIVNECNELLNYNCRDISNLITQYFGVNHLCKNTNIDISTHMTFLQYSIYIDRTEIAEIIFNNNPENILFKNRECENLNSLQLSIYKNNFYITNLFFRYLRIHIPEELYKNYNIYYDYPKCCFPAWARAKEISDLIDSYAEVKVNRHINRQL